MDEENNDNTSQAQPSQHRSEGPSGRISRSSDGSHSSDGNDDSGPPNTSRETCIPSTYPYDRDVYFIQGDVGASTHNPTSSPPPPPIGHTYHQSHGDFYLIPKAEPEDNYNIYD